MNEDKFIIVYGSVIDGFNFVGPFDSTDEAIKEAEQFIHQESWWIATLHKEAGE